MGGGVWVRVYAAKSCEQTLIAALNLNPTLFEGEGVDANIAPKDLGFQTSYIEP